MTREWNESRSTGQNELWAGILEPLLTTPNLSTPAYSFSSRPVQEALTELDSAFQGLPVTHFLSVKTQPLPALIQWWNRQSRPVEVVSEWELEMVTRCGVPPERILVNGPIKHHWLPRHPLPGLRIHLDSVLETESLAPLAAQLGWQLGVRLNTVEEFDPESQSHPTQFGMDSLEVGKALEVLRKHGCEIRSLHFHLRTNIADVATYERALRDAARICNELGLRPEWVDVGGGFPPPRVATKSGLRLDRQFSLGTMRELLVRARKWFPAFAGWWMENGRWMTARSGVLITTVRDVKERRGMRNLICDGGRTLNSLVSLWEEHDLGIWPERRGEPVLTTVNGPTCMAFDKLYRGGLPKDVGVGDRILWYDAGAYHLPWETRFSHGLASIWWHDGESGKWSCVREAERFEEGWKAWKSEFD